VTESISDVTIETIYSSSRNKILSWKAPSQRLTNSEVFLHTTKLHKVLELKRIMIRISKPLTRILVEVSIAVFKFGFAMLKSVFNFLRIVKTAISAKR